MRIRICQKSVMWSKAAGTWFSEFENEVFNVIAIHDGLNRLYEVDTSHLVRQGKLPIYKAFVPAAFAEELYEYEDRREAA